MIVKPITSAKTEKYVFLSKTNTTIAITSSMKKPKAFLSLIKPKIPEECPIIRTCEDESF